MEYIGPAIIIGSAFFGIVSIIKAFSSHFLRKKMLDRNNLDPSVVQAMRLGENRQAALKWGLVVLFGGLGLILLSVLPYQTNSPLPFGIEAVMISIGFLLYYFIERKHSSGDNGAV